MGIQEIERAIERLPRPQRAALLERLRANLADGPEPAQPDADLVEQRRRLAEEARPHWSGGDGLDFQRRIRAEWDDRPSRA